MVIGEESLLSRLTAHSRLLYETSATRDFALLTVGQDGAVVSYTGKETWDVLPAPLNGSASQTVAVGFDYDVPSGNDLGNHLLIGGPVEEDSDIEGVSSVFPNGSRAVCPIG